MTPPISIGSEVIITGQPCGLSGYCIGGKGTVRDICQAGNFRVNEWWYPASSLRLVEEELKIGDWVRGIYNGHVFQIDYIKPRMESKTLDYSGKDEPMYLASSLRKLAPEEIQQHLAKGTTVEGMIMERLSAIEKRQEALYGDLAERIRLLEAYQRGEMPEVCDCPNDHCMPNCEPIRVTILAKTGHTEVFTCPADALTWCEKVLDSMREG